ncbi:hypothetical protein N7462_000590 [Penicillium macrosclerotiorum]|uniref:uncharacterized protein n=1 Tax=Penicillium macrosclerotiorum TaxID=303699 RepID=UPI00254825E1|nr:uncharacterized protein N7462_000590 [Penicillium macrosclerotiorum]KAJ5698585.1 hypothetical protein N7462_000590 [Penicillium macrosclerotiorum]
MSSSDSLPSYNIGDLPSYSIPMNKLNTSDESYTPSAQPRSEARNENVKMIAMGVLGRVLIICGLLAIGVVGFWLLVSMM